MAIPEHLIAPSQRRVSRRNRGSSAFVCGLGLTLFGVCVMMAQGAALGTTLQSAFQWLLLLPLAAGSILLIRRASSEAQIDQTKPSRRQARFEQMSRMLAGDAVLDLES